MKDKQNTFLTSLKNIVQSVQSACTFENAITTLVESLRDITKADCCSIYLLNKSKKYLTLEATVGLQKDSIGKATLAVGEGLVGLVAKKQELLNLADAPSHPNFKYLPDVGEDEFLSFLGVPIINQGELLGVLVIQCKEKRLFGEKDEAFLITLSAQIASTISLNRSTKEIEDFNCKRFKGKHGSGSIAIAQAVVWKPPVTFDTIHIMYSDDKEIQSELFHQTVFQLQTEMDRATLHLQESSNEAAASGYMSSYGSMLDDISFEDDVDSEIFSQGYVAASAIKVVATRRIEEADKAGETDKSQDIRDFASILISRLVHLSPADSDVTTPIILVVKSMPAAFVAEIPRDKVVGFVCVDNSTSSHTTILARDLGIPAVIDVNLDLNEIDGHTMIVDGQNAEVLVDPISSVVDEYMQLISQTRQQHELFEAEKYEKGITLDGQRINIQLNAGLNSQDDDDLADQTDGIGLYRTEIAYMLCQSLPSEETQLSWYKELLERFKDKPVCMRTLDIGGDKGLNYLPIDDLNPALGFRGIRVCIDQPNIIKTQLKAMLLANKDLGNLEIMLPMISRLEEVIIIKRILNEAIHEIEVDAGCEIKKPKFGVMVEVPCIAFIMDELAKLCDFFSIGSNDLIQYLFAADRSNPKVSKIFDPFNPAAIRCFKYLLDKSAQVQRPIAVCGEIAGSPLGALMLLSLGYTTLSMNYSQIARVKHIVRHINLVDLLEIGKQALTLDSPDQIRALYKDYAKKVDLERIIDLNKLN